MTTLDQKLIEARVILVSRQPFIRAMLYSLTYVATDQVPTLATSRDGVVSYNPEFLAPLPTIEIAGALYHEALHLLLGHHKRHCSVEHGITQAWNIAEDRAINPMVLQAGLRLPSTIKPCFPADINMPDGRSAEEYYQADPKSKQGQGQPKPGQGQGQGKQGQGQPQPGMGSGQCGSCAGGAPAPGEAQHKEGAGSRENRIERAGRQVLSAIREAAANPRTKGTVPGALALAAELAFAPTTTPWQTLLERAVRAATEFRRGHDTSDYTHVSRRQAALGYGSGIPVCAHRRSPDVRVAVALDTSGSMSHANIETALSETAAVLAEVESDVYAVVCDAQVHAVERIATANDLAGILAGGGGTDFRPAFRAIDELPEPPHVLVFLTDGYGTFPAQAPEDYEVIWVMIGDYTNQVPFGQAINAGVS
jgi:predicted metal-dependent peptidase